MTEQFDEADEMRVQEALLEALEPAALPPARREAMKRRLLARVQAAGDAGVTASAAAAAARIAESPAAADSGMPGIGARERSTDSPHGTRTVRAEEGEWRVFAPRVQIKVLLQDGDCMSYLLRLEPGAMLPPHHHPQSEECIVLEGEVRMGDHVVRRGDYHVARGGLGHGLLRSDTGALIFLRGAVPSARQVRWRSLDAYAPLLPRALRDRIGRWKAPS